MDLIKSLKDKYSKIEIITRKYPSNHINTLRLVKNSDLLISFDALSNINYESTLLGTPVLALDDFFKIMKEVQISHYGYAFDESEIDMARLSVGKAFDEYLKIIQKQGDDFVDVIHNALAHFKRVETNLEYRKEYDKYAEECINSNPSCSFENISSLNNIPLILRKKMRINSKELSIKTEIKYILYKLGLYNCSMSLYKRLKNRTL